MAEIIVSSLVAAIVDQLKSQVLKEFGIANGLGTELQKFRSTFTAIQAVIEDAEAKQRKSKQIEDWLDKLKDAAYVADDVLDDFYLEALQRRLDSHRGLRGHVSTFFSTRNPIIFRFKMGHKIRNVRERLDAIAAERKFHLMEAAAATGNVIVDHDTERRQTSSLVNESVIFGRDAEKDEIVEFLLNNPVDHDDVSVSVFAIWGMGGLGKTTLAQLVYNDKRLERHFELKIWVTVSDDFGIQRLTRAIIESIGDDGHSNIANLDPLQRRLQEKLGGKRFLIVLDDVWNENYEKWEGLREALRCGGKGSTVLVTTRKENVARQMASLNVHRIGRLSDDDCWSLFRRRAFEENQTDLPPHVYNRNEENRQEFEAIGRVMLKRCGGVPLAVKALGGLMRSKSSTSEWSSVRDNELWNLSENDSSVLSVLKLSYYDLPPHVRQCFAFCSIYPKDYTMERNTLIQLWMANGFIPSRGRIDLHDLGLEIFNLLVWGSFLQDVEDNRNGKMTCKMHDLMHDLAQTVARGECFMIEHNKALQIPGEVRHLSFSGSRFKSDTWNEDLDKVQRLRSIIMLSYSRPNLFDHFHVVISKLKYIRVLDLSNPTCEQLVSSISHLKHLRYLSLSHSWELTTLPESITFLQDLQTLKLMSCYKLCKLPNGMKNMTSLRHLDIRHCNSLRSTPSGLGGLTRLKTLSIFIVGIESGYRICELEKLSLGGELSIKELDNVRDYEEARSANLERKHNLASLNLSWRHDTKDDILNDVEEILDGLQPHSNLRTLKINSYRGLRFPNWFMDLVLQNLVHITLTDCNRCERLPPLGKLPRLKVLVITEMNSVKCFNDDDCPFPALVTLILNTMPNLEEWTTSSSGGQSFPCLSDLQIDYCPKLTGLPPLLPVTSLSVSHGNPMLVKSVVNLQSLSQLSIFNCPNLNSLPDGLKDCRMLKQLTIFKCPQLERRCKKESGEDWPKIAHIPSIKIRGL